MQAVMQNNRGMDKRFFSMYLSFKGTKQNAQQLAKPVCRLIFVPEKLWDAGGVMIAPLCWRLKKT